MDDFGTIWEGEYALRKQSKSGTRKSSRSNRTPTSRMAAVAGDFDAVRSMEFSSSKTMMNREVPASFKGSKASSRTGDRYYYHNSTNDNTNKMYDEVFATSISTIPAFEDVFNSARMKLSELRDNDIFRAFRRIPGSSRVSYEDVFRHSPDRSSGHLMGSKVGTSSSRGSSSGRQSPAAHSGVLKRESTESSRSFRESPRTSNNVAPDAALKIPVLGSFLSMSGTFSRQGPADGPELSRSSMNSSQRKSEPEKQGSVKKEEMRTSKGWVTVGDVSLITKSTENPPPARSAPALQEDISTLETTREASGPPPVRVPPAVTRRNMPPEVKEPSHTRAHSLERILKDRSMHAEESVREKVLAWQMHSLVEQELENPRRTMSLDREKIGEVLQKEVTLFARLKAEVEQEAKHPFVVVPDHVGREVMEEEIQVEEVEEVESGRAEEAKELFLEQEREHVPRPRDQKQEVAEVATVAEGFQPSGAVEALRSSDEEKAGLLSNRTEDPEVVLSSQTAEAEVFRSRPEKVRLLAEPKVLRSSPTAESEVVRSSDTGEPEALPSSTGEVPQSTDGAAKEAEIVCSDEAADTSRSSDAADGEKSLSSEAAAAGKHPASNDEADGEIPRPSEAAESKTEDQKNEERGSASPQRRSTSSDKESSIGIDTISSISEDEQETKAKSTFDTAELHEDPAPETPERLENSNTYKKSEKSEKSSSEEALENAWKEEARKTAEAEAQQRSLVARIQAEVRERAAAKMKAEKAAKEATTKVKAVERRTRPRLKEAVDNSNVGGASTFRISLREQLEMERQLRSSGVVVEGGGKATLAEKITAEVRERNRSVERSRAAASRAEEQQLRQQQLQQQQLQQQLQQQQQQQREVQRLQRERLERERLQEKERLDKLQRERMERELEREREIEREKDRIGLEKKLNEEKARQEREAIAREQAAAAAAAAERARMERAAVERATSEARARAERAAYDKSTRSSSVPRHSVSMPNTGTSQAAEAATASIRRTTSTLNFDSPSSARDFLQKGETPERMKARLERHQRTMDRQARALAQKNQRDLEIQSEQAERQRLAERLDTDIKRWSLGKDGNIRALLSTLQYVLWPDSGWKQVSLTELISSAAVKKAYRRAALCVHPDKMQQKNATVQQKYIAEKVFHILQVAWNKFNSQETL